MKVGLFIPCYINAVYPQVGVASYKLLKSLGVDVDYPQMPVLRVNLWKWLVILTESLKIMIT